MKRKINIRSLILICVLLVMGIWRLIQTTEYSVMPNFTHIGAMAIFGGAYFKNRIKAYMLPIITLLISDIIIMIILYKEYSNGFLYDGWVVNYLAFAMMVFFGEVIIKKVSIKSVLIAGIGAGLIHYIVTDLAIWLQGGLDITTGLPYTRDLDGLIKCFTLALPFLKNMLLGNIIYSAVFFGVFELLRRKFPTLSHTNVANS